MLSSNEARENGLVDPSTAGRTISVPNVPAEGVRPGQWLTLDQIRDPLAVTDLSRLKGKRAYRSALRREGAAILDISHIQIVAKNQEAALQSGLL